MPRMRRRKNATGDHHKRGIFPFSPLLPNMHLFYALVILRREKEVSETSIFVPQQATCFFHGDVFFPLLPNTHPRFDIVRVEGKEEEEGVSHISPLLTPQAGGEGCDFHSRHPPPPVPIWCRERRRRRWQWLHFTTTLILPHTGKKIKKFDTKMSTVRRVFAP